MIEHLSLDVDPMIGCRPEDVALSMVRLANRLEIMITCTMNQVFTIAMPGNTVDDVIAPWRRELAAKSAREFAELDRAIKDSRRPIPVTATLWRCGVDMSGRMAAGGVQA